LKPAVGAKLLRISLAGVNASLAMGWTIFSPLWNSGEFGQPVMGKKTDAIWQESAGQVSQELAGGS